MAGRGVNHFFSLMVDKLEEGCLIFKYTYRGYRYK